MAFTVSPAALARPTTSARDAWACTRKDEKSVAGKGTFTLSTTVPPAAVTMAAASRWSVWPNT